MGQFYVAVYSGEEDAMVAGGAGVNEGEVAGEEGGEPAEG
jgi:hypothetical protein